MTPSLFLAPGLINPPRLIPVTSTSIRVEWGEFSVVVVVDDATILIDAIVNVIVVSNSGLSSKC